MAAPTVSGRTPGTGWPDALDAAGGSLPVGLRSAQFLADEYAQVVLPNRITGREAYYKVRRPGRGVALDRAKRAAVWDVVKAHWQLLRALVGSHANDDLFIAEDSHQRIYGQRVVLSAFGIRIVGRSQRLTLNYRTTARNLGYAMSVLEGSRMSTWRRGRSPPPGTGRRAAGRCPG